MKYIGFVLLVAVLLITESTGYMSSAFTPATTSIALAKKIELPQV